MSSHVLDYPSGYAANVTIGPTIPGTADQYELYFARRGLQRIKDRLGIAATEKLL